MAGPRELRRRDEAARNRRQIMRRASLYTVTFLLAGVVTAVAGAALVAGLMTLIGMPFLRTWLILSAVVVAAAFAAVVVQSWRGRARPPGGSGTPPR